MKMGKKCVAYVIMLALMASNMMLWPLNVSAVDYGLAEDITLKALGLGGGEVTEVSLNENATETLVQYKLEYDSTKVEITNITYSLFHDYQGRLQGTSVNGYTVTAVKGFDYENLPYSGAEIVVTCSFHAKIKNNQYEFNASEQKTVRLNILDVDEPGIPQNRSYTLNEDQSISVQAPGLLKNIGGANVRASISDLPARGTATVNSDGSFSYTPNGNFYGTDSFTYTTLVNGSLSGLYATVTLTVNGSPDAPMANSDTVVCGEDTESDFDVLANDTDQDNYLQASVVDPITITGVTPSQEGGSVTIVEQGKKVRYKPKKEFHGADQFAYTISDSTGRTASATVNVTVSSVNDPPVTAADSAECDEDAFIVVDVLANDADVEGEMLTLANVATPSHGSAEIVSGNVKYTPSPDYFGADSLTYQVSDGTNTSQGTLTVTVKGIQDPPVAVNDSVSCNEDQEIDILITDLMANDYDVDKDTLHTYQVLPSANATITTSVDKIHYKPKMNYIGTDMFTYAISDNRGGTATATVTVSVHEVNDPPIAAADTAECNEDSSIVVDVLKNDVDEEGAALSLAGVGTPSHGSAELAGGKVKYTPHSNYIGTDSCTYQISDGANTSQGILTIVVKNSQDSPVAENDSYIIDEDKASDFDVLANDLDPDGDNLVITNVTSSSNGTITITQDNKKIHYVPNNEYSGTDSFSYTISDGQGGTATATVNLAINPVNDLPVPRTETFTCLEDSTNNIFDVLANDTDPEGDPLTLASNNSSLDGRQFTIQDNKLLYTPKPNFFGTEHVVYMISDGNKSISSSCTISVTNVPDMPTAENDNAGCNEDAAIWIDVLSNDEDLDNDSLTILVTTSPKNGTAVVSGSGINYKPKLNWHGTDDFGYTINDGNGGTASATVTVTVSSFYDMPLAKAEAYSVDMNKVLTIATPGVLGNDSGPEGTLTAELKDTTKHGTLTFKNDGSFVYKPDADWTGNDSFTYRAFDGKEYSDIIKVTVDSVKPVPASTGGNTSGGGSGGSAPATTKAVEKALDKNGYTRILPSEIKAGATLEVRGAGVGLILKDETLKKLGPKEALEASIRPVNKETLSEAARKIVGNHPVFDISLMVDGKRITDTGKIEIELPYTPSPGEDVSRLAVYYISADGKLEKMAGGHYDPVKKAMVFTTDHLSVYAIGIEAAAPATISITVPSLRFTDVPSGYWAEEAINRLAEKSILKGKAEGIFAPSDRITRAESVTLLAKLNGQEPSQIASSFTDVPASEWHAPYVAWAVGNGIVKGYGSTFNPNVSITRQDLAVMLTNYMEKSAKKPLSKTVETKAFTDEAAIADYAKAAVQAMQQAGIISGKEGNQFDPTGTATRAEAAKMAAGLMKMMEK